MDRAANCRPIDEHGLTSFESLDNIFFKKFLRLLCYAAQEGASWCNCSAKLSFTNSAQTCFA